MKYVAGVDVGSTQTKAVIVDENRNIVGRALLDMETSMVTVAEDAFRAALDNAGAAESDVVWVAGTGYGRYKITFGKEQITEISCHARGAVTLFPLTRTVIDIGDWRFTVLENDDDVLRKVSIERILPEPH